MPRTETASKAAAGSQPKPEVELYSATARRFHWIVVGLIAMQVPVGVYMVYRGATLNIWDGLTNGLYSMHKLIGMVLLLVVVMRLGYRVVHGAPADEPTIETWHKVASALNHWGIYVMLLVVPALGWLGVSYYPALDIFGIIKLPGLVAANQKTAELVFQYHGYAAFALIALVAIHVAAALYHHFIRGDNVLARMIPGLLRK